MKTETRSMFEESVMVSRLQDESAILLLALQQVAKDLRRFRIKANERVYYSGRLDETKEQVERIIDHMEGRKPMQNLGALSARLTKIMKIEDGAAVDLTEVTSKLTIDGSNIA